MSRIRLVIHKLLHWEYWPFYIIYIPGFIAWFYLAIRSRSLFFFLPSNPRIKNAGFLLESKKEIYDIMPQQHIPSTVIVSPGTDIKVILNKMKSAGINFPCIAKPDIGMKGLGVAQIENPDQLILYTHSAPINFLVQEYINLPNEIGIFYYRMPEKQKGSISGIVKKEFLSVTGNGKCSIEQLIQKDARHLFQLPQLKIKYGTELNRVPSKGELINLVAYGNHARGAKFIDHSKLADKDLINFIDEVCQQIPSFYFGRLDIRYNTIEELKNGKNFKIIELNGAGSEPTHIYDPNNSLIFAWKEIIRHLKLLYKISSCNHAKGHPHMAWKDGLKMLKENNKLVLQLKYFNNTLSLK